MNLNPDNSSIYEGRIYQINLSSGGVPKCGTLNCLVTENGLVGDHQSNTKYHGGIEQAVCLYSLDRILALQEEGHPIFPGSTGENLTVSGLDWEIMIPGVRLQVGDHILLELTKFTSPCSTIAGSFLKENIQRISQKNFPGWSRIYGRVLQPGVIKNADKIRVINPSGNH